MLQENQEDFLIEIVSDWNRESRDCYLAFDGVPNRCYTKEGEFAGTIRNFLYENPEAKVIGIGIWRSFNT
jgi:hypothetical protein